ncbi:MAG: RNA methyltransferase [Deltaproteobacteria bacterium]|nr:RNA methyltransferase [Deltaproteobacteria bacterium]
MENTPLTGAQLKEWGKLKHAKHRQVAGLLLVEGKKTVVELLKSEVAVIALLCTDTAREKYGAELQSSATDKTPLFRIGEKQFAALSQEVNSEGIIAVANAPFIPAQAISWDGLGKSVILLQNISDPGNLGAIIRSALWFSFDAIISGDNSVSAGNHKVIKASVGGLFHLPIYEGANFSKLIPSLLAQDYAVIAGMPSGGKPPRKQEGKIALLFGSEAHGLHKEMLPLVSERWSIGGTGKIDSLSLPQAAAIMMYACRYGSF